jgi:hypothetical protein
MRSLTVAVAAIALMAGVAHAQGQGQGGGNDRGGGKPAAAGQQGGGNGGDRAKAERGHGDHGGPAMAQARGPEQRGSDNRGGGNGNSQREQRGNASADRGNSGAERGNRGNDRAGERASADNRGRGNDRTVVSDRRSGNRDRDGNIVRVGDFGSIGQRGLISGCPPGLAKKNPPCVPPGQVRGGERSLFGWDRPDFWGLSGLGGGRYFYDDGYLVRLGPDGRIGGYVPLLGGALSVGNAWPSYYEPFEMPGYYEQYYGLGEYDSYRYADDVIYRVDPETSAITSIVALLTGDQFAVGQPMPRGYDVYNVPYDYRGQYLDGPDANYRYADGYVYQVDPKTQLIAAAIQLLAS